MVRSDLGTHCIGLGVESACEPHHAARRCALSVRRTADLEEVKNNRFGGAAVRSERTEGNCAVHSSAQDVCCGPPRHVASLAWAVIGVVDLASASPSPGATRKAPAGARPSFLLRPSAPHLSPPTSA